MKYIIEVEDSRMDGQAESEIKDTVSDMVHSGGFDLREVDAFSVKVIIPAQTSVAV